MCQHAFLRLVRCVTIAAVALGLAGCTVGAGTPAPSVSRAPITQTPFDPPLAFDTEAAIALPDDLTWDSTSGPTDGILDGVEFYTHDRQASTVVAIDVRTGTYLWKRPLGSGTKDEPFAVCNHVADHTFVYTVAATRRKTMKGYYTYSSIVAIRIDNGEVAWKSREIESDPVSGDSDAGCAATSLELSDTGLLASSFERATGIGLSAATTRMFDPSSGALLWTVAGEVVAHSLNTADFPVGDSSNDGNFGVLVVGSGQDQGAWVLDLRTGQKADQLITDSLPSDVPDLGQSRLVLNEVRSLPNDEIFFRLLLFPYADTFYRFSAAKGTLVTDPFVLGAGDDDTLGRCALSDTVMVCSWADEWSAGSGFELNTEITAFSISDGHQIWSKELPHSGSFLISDNTLYNKPSRDYRGDPWPILDAANGRQLAMVDMPFPLLFNGYGAILGKDAHDEKSGTDRTVPGTWVPARELVPSSAPRKTG